MPAACEMPAPATITTFRACHVVAATCSITTTNIWVGLLFVGLKRLFSASTLNSAGELDSVCGLDSACDLDGAVVLGSNFGSIVKVCCCSSIGIFEKTARDM